MPRPHSPAKKLEEHVRNFVCASCCMSYDGQTVLVPSEPASARPMSEVSPQQFTPRTPTGPPPVHCDQVSVLERRLQSSIALIMEQQYQRLSGEVLDVLRCSQRKSPPQRPVARPVAASTSRPSVSVARPEVKGIVKSVRPNGNDPSPAAPDDAPPLLKPGSAKLSEISNDKVKKSILVIPELEQSAGMSPHKLSLQGQKYENGNEGTANIDEHDGKASDPKLSYEGIAEGLEVVAVKSTSAMPTVDMSVATVDTYRRTDCKGDSVRHISTQQSATARRARMSSSYGESVILTEVLKQASMRQREKRLLAMKQSKFRSDKVVERDSITGEILQEPFVERIINNPFFDSFCALVIVMNSVLIGVSTEWLTTHDEETGLLIFLGHICNVFFLGELMMRLAVFRLTYFTNEDRTWNFFDCALVMFSVIDFAMWATIGNDGAGSVGSTLKIVKMLRIVRIFRVFRFFKELSLLALMIMDSLRSLVWALLMLTIIIYVFAICFTQNATEFLRPLETDDNSPHVLDLEVRRLFGSLPKTIYSLVKSMLDGVSWGIVSDALMHMDAFSSILFFFYISFTVLAVLNIITGVFVDNAVETAKTEREFLIQKEMELREKLLAEMRQLFDEMDEDKSGSVNFQELSTFFNDQRVQTYFQALGLDPSDAERLFRLIDTDGSGEVQVSEFLNGCIRLKGEARSIDVNTVIFQCKQIQARLDALEHASDGVDVFGEAEALQELEAQSASTREKSASMGKASMFSMISRSTASMGTANV